MSCLRIIVQKMYVHNILRHACNRKKKLWKPKKLQIKINHGKSVIDYGYLWPLSFDLFPFCFRLGVMGPYATIGLFYYHATFFSSIHL